MPSTDQIYAAGPFKGKQAVHPYHTVLSRLNTIGLSPLERMFGESERSYVERMNRAFSNLFTDVLAGGLLNDKA
jgi:hypothetical protein